MAQIKNSASIKSNRLFTGIPDLNFNFKEKNYLEVKEGEVIFSKGDKSEYVFLVISGRVKFKVYEGLRQTKVFIVSRNEFFGEKELIDKTVRNSSAVAEKTSSLFRINYKDFIKLSSEYRKILSNLNEKRYEEVASPLRNSELKSNIFSRFLNDSETEKMGEGIEIKDYSGENPLLEMKAKDEITEELKMYREESENGEIPGDDDLLVEDKDVRWSLDDDEDSESSSTGTELIDKEEIKEEVPEPAEEESEPADNIVENFMKIQDQVNILRESLDEAEEPDLDEIPLEVEPFRFKETAPNKSFIAAVEKLSLAVSAEESSRIIVEACTELVNAEHGILYSPDKENVLNGKLFEEDKMVAAGPETIPARCFRESEVINIKDVYNDLNFNPTADYVSFFHIHNLICLPVTDGETIKAVLQIFNSRNGEFSADDEKLLKSITPVVFRTIERCERYSTEKKEIESIPEKPLKVEEKAVEPPRPSGKQVSLKVISDFLLKEFQVVVGDIKQFNMYLQKIDIPGEAKEISDIVTNQTSKIIDLLESLKVYSDKKLVIREEKESYITVLNEMMSLLAEYTESRKVNLYKRFDSDALIAVNSKFLYLAIFQIIKYQCDLMPFGGNIFVSSEVSESEVEIIIRNATRKTDENLVINSAFQFDENSTTGFGLSLAKRIIEEHNAGLSIKNQSGTGLEIGIRFPAAK